MSNDLKVAAERLRPTLIRIQKNPSKNMQTVIDGQEEVYARYQPIFSLENIRNLTEEQFKSFLLFRNNRHWWGLHRFGGYMTADMEKLRSALACLLDESKPIKDRLDYLLPNSGALIPRMGGATLTPILHVAHPEKYGVFNSATKAGLKAIELLPQFDGRLPFSERYVAVNELLIAFAKELQVDLWILDAIWWQVVDDQPSKDDISSREDAGLALEEDGLEPAQLFGLERYLQEFIRDNWEMIKEFKDWFLYEEDGNQVGFEYNTNEIGRIDLLAHHKSEPRWLVIELKRGQTSDQTVGQVLRYMGWVYKNLADPKELVEGMVICKSSDASLNYALLNTKNVRLLVYEVDFQLHLEKQEIT